MADDTENWISAAGAIVLLTSAMSRKEAEMTIIARANDGMIRSRAARLITGRHVQDDVEVPLQFWWARGHSALEQNWQTGDFETWIDHREHWRAYGVEFVRSHIDNMIPDTERPDMKVPRSLPLHGTKIFIGHGHSQAWRELKDFVVERLKLPFDEFNAVSPVGLANVERLSQMLDDAIFACLVLTAEDERADGGMQARMNVIHEAGLFQGRLGFRRAIILLEEGCDEFSNITGLSQIRFHYGLLSAKFEEIRHVLERESILPKSRASAGSTEAIAPLAVAPKEIRNVGKANATLSQAGVRNLAERHGLFTEWKINPQLRFDEGDISYWHREHLRGLSASGLEAKFESRREILQRAEKTEYKIPTQGDLSNLAHEIESE